MSRPYTLINNHYNHNVIQREGHAKFELAFHSCLCENFVDGNNLAYSQNRQKENDLGLALESPTVTMPALTGSADLPVTVRPAVSARRSFAVLFTLNKEPGFSHRLVRKNSL